MAAVPQLQAMAGPDSPPLGRLGAVGVPLSPAHVAMGLGHRPMALGAGGYETCKLESLGHNVITPWAFCCCRPQARRGGIVSPSTGMGVTAFNGETPTGEDVRRALIGWPRCRTARYVNGRRVECGMWLQSVHSPRFALCMDGHKTELGYSGVDRLKELIQEADSQAGASCS